MTSPSAVYAVINALVEQLPAAVAAAGTGPDGTAVEVYDGFPVGEQYAREWVLVGVEDPMIRGAATSATAQQEWASIGAGSRDETGEITCAASSWNGNGNARLARDRVEAITASIELYLRERCNDLKADPTDPTDPGLGYAAFWIGYGTRTALRQAQDDQGAEALVVFTIAFRARL